MTISGQSGLSKGTAASSRTLSVERTTSRNAATGLTWSLARLAGGIADSPRVAKLQIDAVAVSGAWCVFAIHVHALLRLNDEVHARPDGRIHAAIDRYWCLTVQPRRSGKQRCAPSRGERQTFFDFERGHVR